MAKILIIEDEKHIAEGLKLNLSLCGHEVTCAKDGVEGLDIWETNSFDLIILDIMMPKLDGHGVLKVIREI